jgi:hypothetical protein
MTGWLLDLFPIMRIGMSFLNRGLMKEAGEDYPLHALPPGIRGFPATMPASAFGSTSEQHAGVEIMNK